MIPGQTLTGQVSSIITNDMNTSTPGQDSYCVLNNKNQAGCNANQPGPPESAPTSSVIDPLGIAHAPARIRRSHLAASTMLALKVKSSRPPRI